MVPLGIHIGALASMPRTLSSSPLRHIASKQKAKNGKCGTAKKMSGHDQALPELGIAMVYLKDSGSKYVCGVVYSGE